MPPSTPTTKSNDIRKAVVRSDDVCAPLPSADTMSWMYELASCSAPGMQQPQTRAGAVDGVQDLDACVAVCCKHKVCVVQGTGEIEQRLGNQISMCT
jgi:hypothetical protein